MGGSLGRALARLPAPPKFSLWGRDAPLLPFRSKKTPFFIDETRVPIDETPFFIDKELIFFLDISVFFSNFALSDKKL